MSSVHRNSSFAESLRASVHDICGHHVWTGGLGEGSLVVDIGANRGEFSREIHERTGCRCLAAEPNPALALVPGARQVTLDRVAIAGRDGPVTLHLSKNDEASSILRTEGGPGDSIEVPGLRLSSFLARHHVRRVDLLKLDAEGAEIQILESLTDDELSGIPQLTIEFHDFLPDLEQSRAVAAALARLRRLGFATIVFSGHHHADVLALHRTRSGLGSFRIAYVATVVKYLDAMRRRAGRIRNRLRKRD